ncbi:MAG: ATP phosphoribosyltransferase [Oscillospiraceae bacterium]|nr:ATP phosphoribosyltransferase [Oscillospiraceae bacterium]
MINSSQQHKERRYAALEKNFVSYADLTTVNVLDRTTDAEPFVTLPSLGKGLIGKYIVRYDIENLQKQNIVVRKGVFEKLQNVDAALKRKKGYENCQLVVVYGYRSMDVQQQLFNDARENLSRDLPGLGDGELSEIVHRRVAVPSVAGHPTGGAVDVAIYDFAREVYLDFGTDVRDFSTKDVYYDSDFIDDDPKKRRKFLRTIMTAEGFAPYNGKWWHFSYGDKEWAYYKNKRTFYKQRGSGESDSSPDGLTDVRYLYAQKSPSELVFADKYRESATVERVGLIKMAVQKKGRLTDDTIDILRKSGIDVAYNEGKFFGKCANFPLEILFVRDDDIPSLVDAGAADIGIVGENTYNEYDSQSEVLKKMGFGHCSLAIAVPASSEIGSIFDLTGKRLATSYPLSVERFLRDEGIEGVQIVNLSGSVEMAPALHYADAVVDLVSTGSSLRQNNLKFLHKIYDSQSILIANKASLADLSKRETVDRLTYRIDGYLNAKKYKQLIFNLPASQIDAIKPILASAKLTSKTDALGEGGLCVVRAVVSKKSLWETVDQLSKSGASDIVFYDIESIL